MLGNIISNSASAALIKGASLGVRVFALFLYARYSSPEAFGTVVFFLSITEISRAVADFGIETANMREFASLRSVSALVHLLRASITMKLVLGSVIAVIASFLMLSMKSGASYILTFAFSCLVITPMLVSLPINFKLSRMQGVQILPAVMLSGLLSSGAFTVLLLFVPNQNIAFLSLPFFELALAIYLTSLNPLICAACKTLSFKGCRSLIHHASPLGISIVIGLLYGRMDLFALDHFSNSSELGYYSFAIKFIEPFQFAAAAIAINAYSHISLLITSDPDGVNSVFKKYLKFMLTYAFGSAVIVSVFAVLCVEPLFPKFTNSIPLIILCTGLFIVRCLCLLVTAGIQARGRFRLITCIALWNMSFLFFLLMSVKILLPKFNALNVAISVLCMETVNAMIQVYIFRRIY